MRKLVVLLIAAVVTAALAVPALAGTPLSGATYSGTVADFLNNGPHWQTAKRLRETVSFHISSDGRHVLHFVGRYHYYCGAGSSTITARSLVIVGGSFSGTGKRTTVNGVNYYALSGTFGAHRTATVTYQDDFVYTGKHVSDPYSYAYHRPAQACESRATGTVRAMGHMGHGPVKAG